MVVIGITGAMGTGKSTVAGLFARFGARVIDADRIAHLKMEPHSSVWKKLINAFGREILVENDRIDRRELAQIVFAREPRRLKELNSIIHPEVLTTIHSKIAEARREGIPAVVIDAPLLIEAGLEEVCDKVIVVTAGKEMQKKRTRADDRFSYSEIKARTSFQLSPEDKKKKADYIIDNGSSLENTRRQVNEIWEGIK